MCGFWHEQLVLAASTAFNISWIVLSCYRSDHLLSLRLWQSFQPPQNLQVLAKAKPASIHPRLDELVAVRSPASHLRLGLFRDTAHHLAVSYQNDYFVFVCLLLFISSASFGYLFQNVTRVRNLTLFSISLLFRSQYYFKSIYRSVAFRNFQ